MEDGGVTDFKHPVTTCCMRIGNTFKHVRYSYRSNAFIHHGGLTCY